MTVISAHLVDNKEEGWGRLRSAMGRLHPVVSPGVDRSFPPAVPFCFLLVQKDCIQ